MPLISHKAPTQLSASDIPLEKDMNELPVTQSVNHKANYFDPPEQHISKLSKFMDKEVCRDKVQVTYRVTDQNAVTGVFKAEVQAQGIVVGFSEDNDAGTKQLKIKSTGWFSYNANLQQWQSYLKTAPLAEGLSLKIGAEFWNNHALWYLCGGITL